MSDILATPKFKQAVSVFSKKYDKNGLFTNVKVSQDTELSRQFLGQYDYATGTKYEPTIPQLDIKFPYGFLSPSTKLTSLNSHFINVMENCKRYNEYEYEYEDCETDEEKKKFWETMPTKFKEESEFWMLSPVSATTTTAIKTIKCFITYPVSKTGIFEFTLDPTVKLTNLVVTYAYTIAYKLMYDLEDFSVQHPTGEIPGMLNRQRSTGPFGIWGHHIGDLVYNGINHLAVVNEDTLFCQFGCDS